MKFFLLLSIVSGCTALASQAPAPAPAVPATKKFQLKYFNARGAAEGCRLIFAIAEEDYEDTRYEITPGTMEAPAFKAAKENGDLAMNLNRAPVLITPEGVTIGQSKAIERFLARRFGMMGIDDVEAALIDCIAEHCRDVKDAQMRKRFSMFVKDRTDEEKEQAQKEWFETEMPVLLAKIEASVKQGATSKGFAVGSSISYADMSIYSLLKECFPAYQEATLQAANDCPLLLEICESFSDNPKVCQWMEQRPATNF
jgi:glutathione S-transferase